MTEMEIQLTDMIGRGKLKDPIKFHYDTIMRSVKELCDTPNIVNILINKLMNKELSDNNRSMEILKEACV